MERQKTEDIIKFLKDHIEPMEDNSYGLGYRAAAYLTDGTYLPCVIFRNPSTVVNLAIRRFKEEQSGKSIFTKSSGLGYYDIVKNFVTNGDCVNEYDELKSYHAPDVYTVFSRDMVLHSKPFFDCFIDTL